MAEQHKCIKLIEKLRAVRALNTSWIWNLAAQLNQISPGVQMQTLPADPNC